MGPAQVQCYLPVLFSPTVTSCGGKLTAEWGLTMACLCLPMHVLPYCRWFQCGPSSRKQVQNNTRSPCVDLSLSLSLEACAMAAGPCLAILACCTGSALPPGAAQSCSIVLHSPTVTSCRWGLTMACPCLPMHVLPYCSWLVPSSSSCGSRCNGSSTMSCYIGLLLTGSTDQHMHGKSKWAGLTYIG